MVFYGYVDNGESFIKCKITADTAKEAYEKLERFSARVEEKYASFRGNIECLMLRDENDNNICQSHIDDVQACLESFDRLAEAKQILEDGFIVPENIGFEHNGQWIQNPFYDETLRFKLSNPYEYYGVENVKDFLGRLLSEATECDKKMCIEETLADAAERSRDMRSCPGNDKDFEKE